MGSDGRALERDRGQGDDVLESNICSNIFVAGPVLRWRRLTEYSTSLWRMKWIQERPPQAYGTKVSSHLGVRSEEKLLFVPIY